MIQDIDPYHLDNTWSCDLANDEPRSEDHVVFWSKGKVLLKDGQMPAAKDVPGVALRYLVRTLPDEPGHRFYQALDDDRASDLLARGYAFERSMVLRTHPDRAYGFGAATACHLAMWYDQNRFCGHCGAIMKPSTIERAQVCPECDLHVYPKICPVVICGIIRDGKILLVKYAHAIDSARYALVAGFVEIGESFEEATKRECREETGLDVEGVRFFKSQPWPFSGSAIFGCYADATVDGDVILDTTELGEYRWCAPDEIDWELDMGSVTSELIAHFRDSAGAV